MKTQVQFTSDAFPAYPGEEEQINPGRWGKRVSEFVHDGLQRSGVPVKDLIAEDWGWIVPIQNPGFPLWLGCGNMDEDAGNIYMIFIEPTKPYIWRWFRRIHAEPAVTRLATTLNELLSRNRAIGNIEWYTAEEFNPSR